MNHMDSHKSLEFCGEAINQNNKIKTSKKLKKKRKNEKSKNIVKNGGKIKYKKIFEKKK